MSVLIVVGLTAIFVGLIGSGLMIAGQFLMFLTGE